MEGIIEHYHSVQRVRGTEVRVVSRLPCVSVVGVVSSVLLVGAVGMVGVILRVKSMITRCSE